MRLWLFPTLSTSEALPWRPRGQTNILRSGMSQHITAGQEGLFYHLTLLYIKAASNGFLLLCYMLPACKALALYCIYFAMCALLCVYCGSCYFCCIIRKRNTSEPGERKRHQYHIIIT